jgi:valine dehydrogenase (NAD+)
MTKLSDHVSVPDPAHGSMPRQPLGSRAGPRSPQGLIDDDPEELVVVHDRDSGLHAAVSIQSTVLGPALGGCRFHPYDSAVEAIDDAVRLGRAMTAKASLAGLDLGGGKAVIIGDPAYDRTEAVILAFGRLVEQLGGRYITAEDVGTTTADMDLVGTETTHVVGRSTAHGGAGDPSDDTAAGVFEAMQATIAHLDGTGDLADRRIVVLGVGKVGRPLVARLVDAGADVVVADVDPVAVAAAHDRYGVDVVAPDLAHLQRCDVFAPCALGGIIGSTTVAHLRCRAVVGSANNQLVEPADADRMADCGILYAPDYVVNAGGLIHVADELHGFDPARVADRIAGIGVTLRALFAEAERDGVTPSTAADRLARRRIERRLANHSTAPAA